MPNPKQFWRGELPVFPWGRYGGAMKRALKVLKYDNQRQIAQPLGYWLADAWLKSSLAPGIKPTVVPIPLHAKKLSDRGFNQAELLAQSFCQATGLSLQGDGLERVRDTKPQFGLSEIERKQNIAGAFGLGKGFQKRRPTSGVLLLDDIYTSGKTASEAADTLRQHGISVYGIVAIATGGQPISLPLAKPVH
jgi:ComF family protein